MAHFGQTGQSWGQRVAEAEAARPFALRAAYGFGQLENTNFEDLPDAWEELPDRWLKVRELFGEGVAEGVAWSLLQTMAATQGADKTRDFLAAALGRDYPEDARAWIDFWDPLDDLLEDHAGIEQSDPSPRGGRRSARRRRSGKGNSPRSRARSCDIGSSRPATRPVRSGSACCAIRRRTSDSTASGMSRSVRSTPSFTRST
ncbi:MAG: hypothetical protein R3F11_23765 [Verrucomicrobiales bacterium]